MNFSTPDFLTTALGHKNGGSGLTPRIPTSKWAGEGVGDFEL